MSITVATNQVQAFVEQSYGLRVLQPLIDLPQGVHSRAWLARTDHGDWVVKISDPTSDPPATLAAQCELYDFLNNRGLHAPVVRADRSGARVSLLTGPDTGYPVTLMQHNQFRVLAAQSVTRDELRHVAAQIGRLHTTLEDFPGKVRIIEDRRKSLGEWGRQDSGCYEDLIASATSACFTTAERSWIRDLDARLVAYVDQNFPDPTLLSQAVLHGDLHFEHVRLLPDGAVYFFDFGDLSWGPVAHELAQFLRGFQDPPIRWDRWTDLRSWLLDGYRTEHDLTVDDEAAIDVFMINRVLALAKYVLELTDGEVSARAAEVIRINYRLAEVLLGT